MNQYRKVLSFLLLLALLLSACAAPGTVDGNSIRSSADLETVEEGEVPLAGVDEPTEGEGEENAAAPAAEESAIPAAETPAPSESTEPLNESDNEAVATPEPESADEQSREPVGEPEDSPAPTDEPAGEPEASGQATEPAAETALPQLDEQQDEERPHREFALRDGLELTLEGDWSDESVLSLAETDEELTGDDARELYRAALRLDGAAVIEQPVLATFSGEEIRRSLEAGEQLHLITDRQGREAETESVGEDSLRFAVAPQSELLVLYALSNGALPPAGKAAEAAETAPEEVEGEESAAPETEGSEAEAEEIAPEAEAETKDETAEAQTPAEEEVQTPETVEPASESYESIYFQRRGVSRLSVRVEGSIDKALYCSLQYTDKASGAAGSEVVEVWLVSGMAEGRCSLTMSASLRRAAEEGETLSLYALGADGALGQCLAQNLQSDESVELPLSASAVGVALIRLTDREGERLYTETDPLRAMETLYLTGLLPVDGYVDVTPAEAEAAEGEEMLAAYDISVYADEESQSGEDAWQPTGEGVVVHLYDEAFLSLDSVNVYHTSDDGESVLVAVVVPVDGWITFVAEGFSVYSFTRTIRKIITAGDGTSYLVSVSYEEGREFPAGADLEVRELRVDSAEYEEYLNRSAVALSAASFAYARLFDIAVVDAAGEHLTPDRPVSVSIELLDADESKSFSVLHFGDEVELLTSTAEGGTVSFETAGFSVYSIVSGPEPFSGDERSVSDAAELAGACADNAFYLSIQCSKGNCYFRDTLTAKRVVARTGSGDMASAARWYFEPEGEGYYLYTLTAEGEKRYLSRTSDSFAEFTAEGRTLLLAEEAEGVFYLKDAAANAWLNYSGGNDGFKFWNAKNSDCRVRLTYAVTIPEDPYDMDGRSFGLMVNSGGAYGWALTAEEKNAATLAERSLIIRVNPLARDERLYVARDSEISIFRFEAMGEDDYRLSTESGGETRYLRLEGTELSLTDAEQASAFKLSPGEGTYAGRIRLSVDDNAIAHLASGGFGGAAKSNANEWLSLAELSELSDEDFVVYSAAKVSLADTASVTNGAHLILYTRVWDDDTKQYYFYAVDHDGTLVPCYESGEMIQWVGSRINTLLWYFTEYTEEGTNQPTWYYELKNPYSEKFIAPRLDGQILSDEPIGLTLNGRRYGDYQSAVLAWDDPYYAYAALRADEGVLSAAAMADGSDFYVAVMQPNPNGETLTEIPTVDHTQYGITMKLVNFDGARTLDGTMTSPTQHAVMGDSRYIASAANAGLVSTDLAADGYPVCTRTGRSLGELFADAQEVNHLFTGSTYSGSGYYEFDSTANFATLRGSDFVVYNELGTMDSASKETLKHGQFMPFNDLEPGVYASVNGENLYNATQSPLSEEDPRKYERMLLVRKPDYYFGVEISAGFVQTPNGLDPWGHDIIYEFTGDDDFWLFVDGELVIDLGGIHSALPGKVNFCTGQVSVNGKNSTIYELFRENWAKRGLDQAEIERRCAEIFTSRTVNGKQQWVFKDYTAHTMKLFYMERGAGASNLHMRFNLTSVKPGQVQLSKTVSGTGGEDFRLAEYPFQIFYTEGGGARQTRLLGSLPGQSDGVTYARTNAPVRYAASYTAPGTGRTWEHVYFLKSGETAEINLPDGAASYSVVECAVNPGIYDGVTANGTALRPGGSGERLDYAVQAASADERPQVGFDNHVRAGALRTLTIQKQLYDERYDFRSGADNSACRIDPGADSTGFNFRLWLAYGADGTMSPASMQTYYVRDPNGNYCRWDRTRQSFVSLGRGSFESMSTAERTAAAFQTSPNGAISRIPNGYSVEVRNLLVGTRFLVEERADEIPDGYRLIGYERVGGTYLIEDGGEPNVGTIRENSDPVIAVHNQRGWTLRAAKLWTDSDFVSAHDTVYCALYCKGEMLEGTLRPLEEGRDTVYFLDSLPDGADFADVEVRELRFTDGPAPDGSFEPLEDGDETRIGAADRDGKTLSGLSYTVSYQQGEARSTFGGERRVRRDTILNSRAGALRIEKTDETGAALAGALFTLSRLEGGRETELGSYRSDSDGLLVLFYPEDGRYLLRETRAPGGYCALSSPVEILVEDGRSTVSGDEDDSFVYDSESGTLRLVNRPFTLRVLKVDAAGDKPLSDVHFALYREVMGMRDYYPLDGMSDLVSTEDGSIAGLDERLSPGTYYLSEKQPPEGYRALENDLRFTITPLGGVIVDGEGFENALTVSRGERVDYTIRVPNSAENAVGPTGYSAVIVPFALMFIFGAALLILGRKRRK